MRTVIIDDHHDTESVVVEQQEGEDTSSTTPTSNTTTRNLRKTTWFTSQKGKEVYEKEVAKKKLLLETHGEKVIYPMKLGQLKIKKGMVSRVKYNYIILL